MVTKEQFFYLHYGDQVVPNLYLAQVVQARKIALMGQSSLQASTFHQTHLILFKGATPRGPINAKHLQYLLEISEQVTSLSCIVS